MKFTARFMHRRHEKPEYFRTIYADTINEAIGLARRYERKGYIMTGCTGAKL